MQGEKKPEAIDAVTFVEKELERKESIIDSGILPQNSISIVGGISKQGKSIFVLNMAIQLATAKPFLSQFNIKEAQKVIYLQAEISEQSMQNRLRKMLDPIDYDLNREMLYIVNQKGIKIDRPRDLRLVDDLIKKHEVNVLILDPLYKFHSGDENKVNDMTRFFDRLDWLITQNNIAIIVIHHFGKPSENREGATQFRGSSAITDYADSYLMLRRKSRNEARNYVKLSFELRNEEEPETMILYRNPETLWYEIMGVEGDKKVSVHDVVSCLEELGGITNKREDLIDALKTKTGAGRTLIKDVIDDTVRLKKILCMDKKGRGGAQTLYIPSMQNTVDEMREVGIKPGLF